MTLHSCLQNSRFFSKGVNIILSFSSRDAKCLLHSKKPSLSFSSNCSGVVVSFHFGLMETCTHPLPPSLLSPSWYSEILFQSFLEFRDFSSLFGSRETSVLIRIHDDTNVAFLYKKSHDPHKPRPH